MKKQGGFTLIEMVVVMVILGILAAVALPRFVNMSSQARIAKMNGAVGAVQSASALVHAKWLAQGGSGTVAIEGGTNLTTAFGYPAAADISTAAGLDSNFVVSAATGVATIREATGSACLFTYTEPTAAGSAPSVNVAALNTTNCP